MISIFWKKKRENNVQIEQRWNIMTLSYYYFISQRNAFEIASSSFESLLDLIFKFGCLSRFMNGRAKEKNMTINKSNITSLMMFYVFAMHSFFHIVCQLKRPSSLLCSVCTNFNFMCFSLVFHSIFLPFMSHAIEFYWVVDVSASFEFAQFEMHWLSNKTKKSEIKERTRKKLLRALAK